MEISTQFDPARWSLPHLSQEDRDYPCHPEHCTVLSPVTIASKETLGRDLEGPEGGQGDKREEKSTWNPADPVEPHPPHPTDSSGACSLRVAPPRRFSKEYNRICTTHKKLVKSGVVKCSVSLSDTPPSTVNLPSAPSSPIPHQVQQQEGSVHWGVVGDFSGVQTPELILEERPSVITLAPPSLPSRGLIPAPPPLPPYPSSLRAVLPSPTLLQGIASLLQQLPTSPEDSSSEFSSHQPVLTPHLQKGGLVRRKISSTDPCFLEASTAEVFEQNQLPQTSISHTMETATDVFRKKQKMLRDARRKLLREMDEFSVDDVCTSRLPDLASDLAEIKRQKNEYQDAVDDFVEEYSGRLDDETVIDDWKREVKDIGRRVKQHAKEIRDRREQLFPTLTGEKKSQEIQKDILAVQQLTLQEKQKKSKLREDDSKFLAKTEANLFFGESSVLCDMMPDENWSEVEDEVISQGMRNLAKWQDQWNQIERQYRKYENTATRNNFSEIDKEAVKTTYDEKREQFEATRDALIKEDSIVRGLYTLEPTRSDIIKYPTFSGVASEDYLKFREIMELRFRD